MIANSRVRTTRSMCLKDGGTAAIGARSRGHASDRKRPRPAPRCVRAGCRRSDTRIGSRTAERAGSMLRTAGSVLGGVDSACGSHPPIRRDPARSARLQNSRIGREIQEELLQNAPDRRGTEQNGAPAAPGGDLADRIRSPVRFRTIGPDEIRRSSSVMRLSQDTSVHRAA